MMAMFHLQGKISGYEQTVAAADGQVAVAPFADPRPYFSVIENGRHVHDEPHFSGDAFDDPQDLPVGVMLTALPHGDAVEETGFSALAFENGF
jgi:hypothetical protein